MRNRINGELFERMVLSGLNNLKNAEEEINRMNVFPVADGDTGTNMRLTLEHGYQSAKSNIHLGLYLKELSSGMLFGARGNSGVILSQIFKGIYQSLARDSIADSKEMRDAFIRGYNVAYKAVAKPVEGTILTVAREGIENIKSRIGMRTLLPFFFSLYIAEMKLSLDRTPILLPLLKEAGVLDSGAYGYILIIEGMYKALINEDVKSNQKSSEVPQKTSNSPVFFDKNSKFESGYCLEFLLQLTMEKNYQETFAFPAFTKTLKRMGTSLVTFIDGTVVKVHIHTFNPAPIISLANNYGEFISFKLENMQLQHNEYEHNKQNEEKLPHKPLSFVAVVDGEGVENLYKTLNTDIIIQGGQTMNTSCEEFVHALKRLDADKIVIFPNNLNIIETARQAVEVSGLDNVIVLPTTSVVEGYYALSMDIPDDEDLEYRLEQINEGSKNVLTVCIGEAIKEYHKDNISCNIGDKVASIDGEIISASNNYKDLFLRLFQGIKNIEDKVALIVLKGECFNSSLEEELNKCVQEHYPSLEIEFIDGDEHIYEALIGVI